MRLISQEEPIQYRPRVGEFQKEGPARQRVSKHSGVEDTSTRRWRWENQGDMSPLSVLDRAVT